MKSWTVVASRPACALAVSVCLSGAFVLAASVCRAATETEPAHWGTIYVLPEHPVYEFLERLSTKGLLPHAPLSTKPWTRLAIARALVDVAPAVANPSSRLTSVDRADWRFYAGEFADEFVALGADSLLRDVKPAWWTHARRVKGGGVAKIPVEYADSAGDARLWIGFGETASHDTASTRRRDALIGAWLRWGRNWGAQGTMRDIAISGSGATYPPGLGPARGFGFIGHDAGTDVYYFDDPYGMVTFASRDITASIGQYPIIFGPGGSDQIILSDHPPPVPQVRLTIHPWPWLTYTFVHLSLQSGVVDSNAIWSRTYPDSPSYLTKYYAAHRLEFTAIRQVDLAVGESVIYGARSVSLRYLIPVLPYRGAQHDEGDLDNLQMWSDFTVERIPWTKVYGALLIDELSLNELFNSQSIHNVWIWQLGAEVADVWGLVPNVDLAAEYTRARPYVYHHKFPWNTYDTWAIEGNDAVVAYPLGFWQGHNGDYLRGEISWKPRRSLKLTTWASRARHGGVGSVAQEYGEIGPPAQFLFGPVTTTDEAHLACDWEVLRDLFVHGDVGLVELKHRPDAASAAAGDVASSRHWTALSLGVTYNVW